MVDIGRWDEMMQYSLMLLCQGPKASADFIAQRSLIIIRHNFSEASPVPALQTIDRVSPHNLATMLF